MPASDLVLRTPQVRVLAALQPTYSDDPPSEWPLVNRAQLAVRAGYTAISGTITRVLNGIRAGSSSGDPHPGLLVRGLVEVVILDVEGVSEVNYRATAKGVMAYLRHTESCGRVPEVRDRDTYINDRYRKH